MKNKAYWNEFYGNTGDTGFPEPSLFLKEYMKYLKKQKVLEIACGAGVNSVMMAGSGFEVEAVDFSEVAIKKASELAESKKCGVDYKVQSMDFYLAPLQKYDSVVVIDYKCSPRLLDELKKGLVIGGTLLIEAYTMDYIRHRSDTDLEADECYKPYEFSRTIKGWNLLYYDEIGADSDYKVRAILSKPPY